MCVYGSFLVLGGIFGLNHLERAKRAHECSYDFILISVISMFNRDRFSSKPPMC